MQQAIRKTTNVRALAAQALAMVAIDGSSLREVLARSAPLLADSRDRSMLGALLHQGARWWLRYDAALVDLVQKPLKRRQPDIHALLILGLVQLDVIELPTYAAVGATVDATRALNKPHLARLVNAVLRRWIRERDEFREKLDLDPVTKHSMPKWLVDTIKADWPEEYENILAANNIEPPLTLRVNKRFHAREVLAAKFAQAGYGSEPHPWLEEALMLERSTDITRLPGFQDGWFSVQDGAAQVPAYLLDTEPEQRVLDACAAPGGKACHLLEKNDIQLIALDASSRRIHRIHENLTRLKLKAKVVTGDARKPNEWWDKTPYDRILIDAPCSATGVIRRRADVRLHRRPSDIKNTTKVQAKIIKALWPLLKPGGKLLYVTCSILRAENDAIIETFLAEHKDASTLPIDLAAGHATHTGWQILPGEAELDGMFYALIEKTAD